MTIKSDIIQINKETARTKEIREEIEALLKERE